MYSKGSILMGVVAGFISTAAFAGWKLPDPVVVDLDQQMAYGGIGGARNSKDDIQRIYCSVQTIGEQDVLVVCKARDENGTDAQCISFDQRYVASAQAISSNADIMFSWDAGTGQCTALAVTTSSTFEPPTP